MTLTAGTRLGHYDVASALGAGGMGEVYRARDLHLNRDVAIKILPALFTSDPDRLGRFEREARILASLNHPNIAAIYGIEEAGGIRALVLELVEGKTLADRIAAGTGNAPGLPLREALEIARQVADALEAAHEKGIVHRDLKPGNVMISPTGAVKVLDFGLAKADSGPSPNLTHSPVLTVEATARGVLLGTAAYMSPEQARGYIVDKRTDIWAFGCVLYESLTGRKAFPGETLSDTLAAVLEREPDWQALPDATPTTVVRLLKRCLRKDPRLRWRDIADARLDLDDSAEAASSPHARTSAPASRSSRTAVAAVSLFALGVFVGWVASQRTATSNEAAREAAETRLQIPTPPTSDPSSLAISPDGRQIVFVGTVEGRPSLWLRSLDDVTARPLPGTADAAFPFWSPDGGSLGFFADRQLKRIDLGLGTVRTLAPAEGGRGGAWNEDGIIIFQPSAGQNALRSVSASGGRSTELSVGVGRYPQFFPDGHHFVFSRTYGSANTETRGLYVGSLDGGTPTRLIELADSAGVLTASDHVLFVRQETLMAQAIDILTFEARGAPFPVAAGMRVNPPLWLSPLAASRAGPIVYRTGSAGGVRQLAWVDRSGRELSKLGAPTSGMLSPSLSPDGERVAMHRSVDGNTDIWLMDTARGLLSRFTSKDAAEYHPLWTLGAKSVLFSSGTLGFVDKPLLGGSEESPLLDSGSASPNDWSPDGGFLLYTLNEPNRSGEVWAFSVNDDRRIPIANTRFDERDAQFSPDGKWVAYTSDESGRYEVYALRFPEADERVQISTAGGGMARWRSDGRELFYIDLDGKLISVTIGPSASGAAFTVSAPSILFQTRIGAAVQTNSRQQYMVSPDGQRFLMNTLAEEAAEPITVLLNWDARP